MRTFLTFLCILLATSFCLIHEAQAKRFGGGKSFGMQRSSTQYSRSASHMPGQNLGSRASKWVAPLIGLAAGAFLANLLMGNGLGSAMLSWLMIGVLLFFVIQLIRRFRGTHQQPALNSIHQHTRQEPSHQSGTMQPFAFGSSRPAPIPASFHGDTFLREAKSLFIRLQAAYDEKNVNDLKKFTTPDVFAEIQLQLQERGKEQNHTEVITLDAQILDVSEQPQITLHGETDVTTVSVRFTGSLKENGQSENLQETWHFQKTKTETDWSVAGIQQE